MKLQKFTRKNMLQKTFMLLCIISFSLFAIQIEIFPDKDSKNVSSEEISTLISNMASKGIVIDKQNAKKYILENRLLANTFLKQHKKVPKNILTNEKLHFEKTLADAYIKEYQRKIRLSDDVLKSYYLTHKKDFFTIRKISFVPFYFDNFDKANDFYQKNKKNKHLQIPKDHQIFSLTTDRIDPLVFEVIEKNKPNKLTPPFFYHGRYVVLYIQQDIPSKQILYKDAKESIRKILLQKTAVRAKKELLKKISDE